MIIKKVFYIQIVLTLLFASILIFAHEEHNKEKPDTVTVVGEDTIAVNGVPVIGSLAADTTSVKSVEESETVEEMYDLHIGVELFEHMHNKLIHFPIVFIIAALLLSILGYKESQYDLAIKIFVAIALLFGIAAILTGLNQSEVFHQTPKEWVVNIHKIIGIVTIGLIVLWEIFLYSKPLKKYSVIIGIVATAAVLAVGFFGGVIAH